MPDDNANNPALDFDTDMQTIDHYVAAVVEAKQKISTVHLAAVDSFQTTVMAASPAEAQPDFVTVVLKCGLKTVEKITVGAIKDATGVDVGPVVDLVHGIYDEIERAAKAAQSLAVADWIKSIRSAIADAYARDQSGSALRDAIIAEYNQNDEGGRGGYIAGIENEFAALKTLLESMQESDSRLLKTRSIETSMYEAWINQNFNNDCMDGTGVVYIQFADDGTLTSASVLAPLGDKLAGGLNDAMPGAGKTSVMHLDVVKKVCKGDDCMCFEGNNVVRKPAGSDANQTFLSSPDTWGLVNRFTTPS
jgi:hypothetical protein